jgi:hypothetical protein
MREAAALMRSGPFSLVLWAARKLFSHPERSCGRMQMRVSRTASLRHVHISPRSASFVPVTPTSGRPALCGTYATRDQQKRKSPVLNLKADATHGALLTPRGRCSIVEVEVEQQCTSFTQCYRTNAFTISDLTCHAQVDTYTSSHRTFASRPGLAGKYGLCLTRYC